MEVHVLQRTHTGEGYLVFFPVQTPEPRRAVVCSDAPGAHTGLRLEGPGPWGVHWYVVRQGRLYHVGGLFWNGQEPELAFGGETFTFQVNHPPVPAATIRYPALAEHVERLEASTPPRRIRLWLRGQHQDHETGPGEALIPVGQISELGQVPYSVLVHYAWESGGRSDEELVQAWVRSEAAWKQTARGYEALRNGPVTNLDRLGELLCERLRPLEYTPDFELDRKSVRDDWTLLNWCPDLSRGRFDCEDGALEVLAQAGALARSNHSRLAEARELVRSYHWALAFCLLNTGNGIVHHATAVAWPKEPRKAPLWLETTQRSAADWRRWKTVDQRFRYRGVYLLLLSPEWAREEGCAELWLERVPGELSLDLEEWLDHLDPGHFRRSEVPLFSAEELREVWSYLPPNGQSNCQ